MVAAATLLLLTVLTEAVSATNEQLLWLIVSVLWCETIVSHSSGALQSFWFGEESIVLRAELSGSDV